MRDWRVGLKLAAVLAIPLVSFLVIAGVQVGTSIASASNLDGFAKRVALGNQITDLVHELQRERDRTAGVLAALSSATPPIRDTGVLAPDWTAVDRAYQEMRTAISPLLDDPVLSEGYGKAESLIGQLPMIREGVTQGWLRTQAAFDTYTAAIASLLSLLPAPIDVTGDNEVAPEVARSVRGFSTLSLAKELTAQIRGHLYMVSSAGAFEPGEFEKVADVRAQAQAALDRFRADANATQVASLDEVVTGQAVSNASRLLQTIVTNARAGELGVEAEQWWLASTTQLELMRTVERGLQAEASAGVLAASSGQWQATVLGSAAVLALLVVAVVTSVVIGRFMASALRSLREQALHVAQRTLPGIIAQLRRSPTNVSLRIDPVVVNSRDEVGEVAAAFTAVHRSAVRLAAEQATMRRNVNEIFIKLARRSQALVERQLKLLDTMESKETDPGQLANLFRLDHLATRLRRNDENLLVLAEGDSTRHWDQPVDLGTVVTAAIAEIEHYTRVRNEIAETTYIIGYAVTDLVHLIAELLENATMFSPPTTHVSITAESTPGGGAELLIADEGIGMSIEAIAEANEQLATPMSIDVSAAERMGLVVVGHLAKRHDIAVRLKSAYPGTKVLVTVPARLVSAPPPIDEAAFVEPARWLRAEDVLRPHRAIPESVWWSKDAGLRNGSAPAHTPEHPAGTTPALTSSGLPKRTRTSKRITIEVIEPVYSPAEAAEVDPEQTGSMLTSLLSGVRRADTETPEG
ncbi:MAG TPA: nitrate- and nitrite sensing domain-containing protein [Candidatus Limnocylindrales bacterium]|nr:nitrate- and nitrite sensing domain-containing protein [Candidatus Limnocylindrales bacterium]